MPSTIEDAEDLRTHSTSSEETTPPHSYRPLVVTAILAVLLSGSIVGATVYFLTRPGGPYAPAMDDEPVQLGGTTWAYQSIINHVDFKKVAGQTFNEALLGWGDMTFHGTNDRLTGELGATPPGNGIGAILQLNGSLDGSTFRLQARGSILFVGDNKKHEWIYDFIGWLVPIWKDPVQLGSHQVGSRTIVGSVIRQKRHPGSTADGPWHEAGVTGSFWMVLENHRIPLRVAYAPEMGGNVFGVNVTPLLLDGQPAVPPQTMVLITWWWNMQFCDAAISSHLKKQSTDYHECDSYYIHYSQGSFQSGPLLLGGTPGTIKLPNTSIYEVMEAYESKPCTSGFNGIFGMSYFTKVYKNEQALPWNEKNLSADMCQPYQKAPWIDSVLLNYASELPVQQQQYGMAWSGKTGAVEGSLFVGASATSASNPFWNPSTVQTGLVFMDHNMSRNGGGGHPGGFGTKIESIEFSLKPTAANASGSYISLPVPPCKPGWCQIDTSFSQLVIPWDVPSNVKLTDLDMLTIKLVGPSDPVVLRFDCQALQRIEAGGGGNGLSFRKPSHDFVFGTPLFAFYYTVLEFSKEAAEGDGHVRFVPKVRP